MILAPHNIKAVLPPNSLNDTEIFQSHIDRAWLKYFPRYLGHAYMLELQQHEELHPVKSKAQQALAWFALAESVPFLDLVLTSTGFGIVSNPNIAPASTERVKSLANAAMQAAFNAVNNLLSTLSINPPDAWNKCCLLEQGLLRNASEMQAFCPSEITPIQFMGMMPGLQQLEKLQLIPILGVSQYEELINSRREDPACILLQNAAAITATTNEEHNRILPAQELIANAISLLRANPERYPVYHQEMYESPHQNNENNYPVFGC